MDHDGEPKDVSAWKRLIDIMQRDVSLRTDAAGAIREYDEGVHQLSHQFLESLMQEGEEVACLRVKEFFLGLIRLGYIRARVGSTREDGVPDVEKGVSEGASMINDDEMSRLLKGVDLG